MLLATHSHLFLEEFSDDLPQVMERARQAGVSRIYMPNIDSTTIEPMLSVCADYPDFCYPMIGLHPTSVNESYRQELSIVRERLEAPNTFSISSSSSREPTDWIRATWPTTCLTLLRCRWPMKCRGAPS